MLFSTPLNRFLSRWTIILDWTGGAGYLTTTNLVAGFILFYLLLGNFRSMKKSDINCFSLNCIILFRTKKLCSYLIYVSILETIGPYLFIFGVRQRYGLLLLLLLLFRSWSIRCVYLLSLSDWVYIVREVSITTL